ncbi:hypothetical protein [Corynebacterium cystitidis]|uniref:DUF4365 domain-containing protein n=1 Tax=Corynebacterium cystitidis DSM 20524 TaxID=1121357 RepID=A0A1H9WMH4_9CORY|nr:hypothetical protein [Corynebacterium cystitidis]WJY82834.1 hypothetical protein CCYS_09600 [Corynebacterium cystitidis DSM 20524]SES35100.1 hypothetical protein SAMN05661109_02817 [Corynebacterium cystitidis DSM 20524]SNV70012.1 Uncharacterised protein [Corynebacterium cystitidis]
MSAIEDNAVRVFSHIIGRTKRLDPMIDTGDRTPLTDGHIEIYRDEHNQGGSYKLGDRNCIGRLTVQVKGKIANSLSSFSMKREHLEGIEAIGGVVLLVAALRKSDLRPKKLYYADLNVRNTKALLEQMRDGQKTKAVPLRIFPRKPDAVYGLVCHLRESQKNQPIPLEVSSLKELTGMSLTVLREVDMSKRQVFGAPGSSDIVTVRTPSGHDQAIDTVLYFVPEDYLLHDIEGLEVSCGDITFHRIRRRKLNDREVEVFFSPGLSFVFGLESDPETGDRDVKVNFHTQRRLYYALQDLRFLKNMASGSVIEFDSSPALRYQPRGNADDLGMLRALRPFEDMEKICYEFGVDTKLFDVTSLSQSQSALEALENLAHLLLYKGDVRVNETDNRRQDIDIGGLKIRLVWRLDEEKNTWRVKSLFDSDSLDYRMAPVDENGEIGEPQMVTPFEVLCDRNSLEVEGVSEAEALSRTLNLNPEGVTSAYESVGEENRSTYENATVLNLIKAADMQVERRKELLDMAQRLNDWILAHDPIEGVSVINRAQIKYRLGSLSEGDTTELEEIWMGAQNGEYGQMSLGVEAATSILLGYHDGVDYTLRKMPKEDRETFRDFPIYFLYENKGTDYHVGEPNNDDEWQALEKKHQDEEFQALADDAFGK